jgi:hypothetical protein
MNGLRGRMLHVRQRLLEKHMGQFARRSPTGFAEYEDDFGMIRALIKKGCAN